MGLGAAPQGWEPEHLCVNLSKMLDSPLKPLLREAVTELRKSLVPEEAAGGRSPSPTGVEDSARGPQPRGATRRGGKEDSPGAGRPRKRQFPDRESNPGRGGESAES